MRGEEVVFLCALAVAGCNADRGQQSDTVPAPHLAARAAWTSTALASPRVGAVDSFVQLASGRILAVGDGTSVEFDITTGTFSSSSAVGEPLRRPALALLPSGKVLVAGSITSPSGDFHEMSVARLYDPTTRTWTAAATLPRPNDIPAAVTTTDGRVALIGAWDTVAADAVGVDLYNPATNTWTTGPKLPTSMLFYPKAVAVGTKTLLVDDNGLAVLFDPTAVSWSTVPLGPASSALAAIGGGKALATGGGVAKIYDVATNAWTTVATPPAGAYRPGAAMLSTGRVLVVGGQDMTTYSALTAAYQYDPVGDKWQASGDFGAPHYDRHRVFVVGDRATVVGSSSNWTLAETFSLVALGASCSAAYECKSAGCVDSVCCGTASCPSDSTCSSPSALGTCKKKIAASCTAGTQCASGNCVDGVCCGSACGGQCEACDVAGSVGSCTAVSGVPHGSRTACTGAGLGTTCGPLCNGVDRTKCNFPGSSTACGSATCTAGLETHVSTCTGAGACGDTPKSCGVYACGATSCKTTCSTTTDCTAGYYCKTGSCVATEGLGKDCTKAADCGTGFCVDGVCCGTSSCPSDSACNAKPSAKGTCARVVGVTCSVDDQCGSGHCVDGICCAATCDGQCEACDVPGHLGACWPVVGAPHGSRTACPTSASPCSQAACDGAKDTKTCAGSVIDLTKECAPARCVDARFTPTTTCDATGTCPSLAATSCVPYNCTDSGCRTSCSTDTQCASGYVCDAGKCGPRVARCSADGLSAVDEAGAITTCAPYLCKKGYCARACVDSTECTSGTACNLALGSCEPNAAPTVVEDSGGCSHSGSPRPTGLPWLGVLALIGLLRNRGAA